MNALDKAHSEVLKGYITAMQWASTDGNDNSLEDFELSQEGHEACVIACAKFLKDNSSTIDLAIQCYPWYNYEQAGHDLFLTREGHGAGFWDRGIGHCGDVMTKYCESIGGCDPYVGDDNLIYLGE